MEEVEDSIDIITLLLTRDLTRLCFQIFDMLDSKSLTNSRLVCQDWNDFIKLQFYQLPKGIQSLKTKLESNILNPEFEPKTIAVRDQSKEELFAVVADEKSVCVSTTTGSISNYTCPDLDPLWTTRLINENDYMVQHCMNEKYVFAVDSSNSMQPDPNQGNIFVLDRADGKVLHKISKIHTHGILGVRVYENSILATADSGGWIKFCKLNFPDLEVIFQEHTYGGPHGYTHLDHDREFLVSGSGYGEVIAWEFKTGKKVHKVESNQAIVALRVKWPLVLTCANFYGPNRSGVKLYDMEKETLIRSITSENCTDVIFKGNVIMICGDVILENGDEENGYREYRVKYYFWNLAQLMDQSRKIEEVTRRTIKTDLIEPVETCRICAIVGSDVFTTEGNHLVQRRFWP